MRPSTSIPQQRAMRAIVACGCRLPVPGNQPGSSDRRTQVVRYEAADRFELPRAAPADDRNGDDAVLRRGVRTAVASARPRLPDPSKATACAGGRVRIAVTEPVAPSCLPCPRRGTGLVRSRRPCSKGCHHLGVARRQHQDAGIEQLLKAAEATGWRVEENKSRSHFVLYASNGGRVAVIPRLGMNPRTLRKQRAMLRRVGITGELQSRKR